MLKKTFESSVILVSGTVVGLFVDVVRVKIIAIVLGTSGLGVLSMLNQFHQLAIIISGLGLGTGVIRYISKFRSEGNEDRAKRVYANELYLTLSFSLFLMLVAIFFSGAISTWIFRTSRFSPYIILYAFSLPLATYPTATNNFIKGIQWVKTLAVTTILKTVFSAIIIIPLVCFWGITGAVVSVLATTFIQGAVNAVVLFRAHKGYVLPLPVRLDKNILGELFYYSVTSTSIAAVTYFTPLLLRRIIVQHLSVESNGIYQCAWGLTVSYISMAIAAMSSYFLPHVCELKTNQDTSEALNGMIYTAVLLMMPLFLFYLVFGRWVILILYSSSFSPAYALLPLQIAACLFYVITTEISLYALASKRLIVPFVLETLYAVVLITLAYLFIGRLKLLGISMALASSYALKFFLYWGLARVHIRFRLWTKNIKLITSSFFIIGLLWWVTMLETGWTRIAFSFVCCSCWAFFVLRKSDIVNFKGYAAGLLERVFAFLRDRSGSGKAINLNRDVFTK